MEPRQEPMHVARRRSEDQHRRDRGPLRPGRVPDGARQPQHPPRKQHQQPDSDRGHLAVHRVAEAHPCVPQRRIVHADGLTAIEPVRPAPPVPPPQGPQPLRSRGMAHHVAARSPAIPGHHIPADPNHRRDGTARPRPHPHRSQPPPLDARRTSFARTRQPGVAATGRRDSSHPLNITTNDPPAYLPLSGRAWHLRGAVGDASNAKREDPPYIKDGDGSSPTAIDHYLMGRSHRPSAPRLRRPVPRDRRRRRQSRRHVAGGPPSRCGRSGRAGDPPDR